MKNTGFNRYVCNFSVDYDATDTKMSGFVKTLFFVGLTISSSFTNANSLSYISMRNQVCKTRPQVVSVNGDEPVFSPFSIKTSKCSGKLCVCKNLCP